MRLSLLINFLISLTVLYSCTPGIQSLIRSGDYFHADRMIEESLQVDSLNLSLYFTLVQLRINYNNKYADGFLALSTFNELSRIYNYYYVAGEKKDIENIQINQYTLQLLHNKIGEFAAAQVIEKMSVDSANLFLSVFKDIPQDIRKHIEVFRDSMELQEAMWDGGVYKYRDFLKKYPNSVFRNRVNKLLDSTAYNFALEIGSVSMLLAYLDEFPDSNNTPDIRKRLYEKAYETAKEGNSLDDLHYFISQFPDAPQVHEVKFLIEQKEFNSAIIQNTEDAYTKFLEKYPQSRFSEMALDSIKVRRDKSGR